MAAPGDFKKTIERLYSRLSYHEVHYSKFVKYANGYLKHFGEERLYLVGSTNEDLKLKWSKEGGDSDFIFLSGRYVVPMVNIEPRTDLPCYIWVKFDKSNIFMDTKLIGEKYLPADILRSVSPELFTCLRGFYHICTRLFTNFCKENQTSIGTASNVGHVITTYFDLKLAVQNQTCYNKHTLRERSVRHETFRKHINNRRDESRDVEVIELICKVFGSLEIQESSSPYSKYFQHLSLILREISYQLESFETRTERDEGSNSDVNNEVLYERKEGGTLGQIKATYRDKHSYDFVPALRLEGIPTCMKEWKDQQHLWLEEKDKEDISNMDVFIVARYAPVNPSRKDFCLSFTLAENKLFECMTPLRRQVYLALKACLKGYITEFHKKHDREVKLTTYHLKTIMYRVSDKTDLQIWTENKLYLCFDHVLHDLEQSLSEKKLLHYFVPSNLYANFDSSDFECLLECTRYMRKYPINAIESFYNMDDGVRNEVWISEHEAGKLQLKTVDKVLDDEVKVMEEAILDILRSIPKDTKVHSSILEAIKSPLQLFIEDETPSQLPNFLKSGFAVFGVKLLFDKIIENVNIILDRSSSGAEKNSAFDELKNIIESYFR